MEFKYPRLAVRALIKNSNNQVLIIKRSNSAFMNEAWCLPGGKIDFGETSEKAVIKEVREETNLVCTKVSFYKYLDNLPTKDYDTHFVSLFFICECTGEVRLNKESSEYRWASLEDIIKLEIAFEHDKIINDFFNYKDKEPY